MIYKVVIVDDEPIISEGLKKVIDWNEFNCRVVATADSARAGAETIRQEKPHILITDIKMPGNDGLYMLAGLKSEFPDMQVTVLTGYGDFEYAQRAIRLGICSFLLKPSKMDELTEALREMTRRLDEIYESHRSEEVEELSQLDLCSEEPSDSNSFIVRRALMVLEESCSDKISLSEVAERCYVSQWHLSKLLNKTTGKSFYDLLNEIRIKKAKELLCDPKLRISDISDMVGYSDVSHFSRVFKKETGFSANEYRNNEINKLG